MRIGKLWTLFINDSQYRHKDKVFPISGRYYIHFGIGNNRSICFSWNLWSNFCHVYIDSSDDITFSVALPPISLWFSYEGFKKTIDKQIGIHFHDGGVWWKLWSDPTGWSSTTPKWRDGHFNIIDFLFGRRKYQSFPIEERDIDIPMPEGIYKGKAKLTEDVWKRRIGFPLRIKRVSIDVEKGIPHPGKGENVWDQGDDSTFGITCPARTIAEGVGKLVGDVLHDRVRYGGYRRWTWIKNKRKEKN